MRQDLNGGQKLQWKKQTTLSTRLQQKNKAKQKFSEHIRKKFLQEMCYNLSEEHLKAL